MQLRDMEKAEGGRLVRTEDWGKVRAVSTVRLVSARTLRTTLSMSKSESEWRLMHSALRPASGTRPLSLPLPVPVLSLASALPPPSPGPRTTSRKSSLPSDRDFTRIQTRLSKLSSGVSLTLRPAVLSDSKSVELLLEQEEKAYLKVHLSHKRIPLEVSQRYLKGLCVVYISKSVPEPSESLHDEYHRKETFQVSETGLRFKSEWLYICLKCLEDARVILTVRFGANRSSNGTKGPLVLTDGLEVFRKDEEKRQILDKEVAAILQRRKEEFGARFSLQNFISKNKSAARHFRALPNTLWDEEHRREVLERRQLFRQKRVETALLSLKRPEIRLDRKRKEEEMRREKSLRTNRERHWMTGMAAAKAVSELWSRFELRKIALEDLKRRVKAAIRLQICFKRCILTLDPRQLTLRRAQSALNLYISSTALTIQRQNSDFLGGMLRTSWKSQLVKGEFDRFLRQGKEHSVVRIQQQWREFREAKERWRQRMEGLWEAEMRLGTKGKKRKKEEIVIVDRKARDVAIGRYWEDCRTRFKQKWTKYQRALAENSQNSDLPPSPSFHPLPSKSELQLLIRHSQSFA